METRYVLEGARALLAYRVPAVHPHSGLHAHFLALHGCGVHVHIRGHGRGIEPARVHGSLEPFELSKSLRHDSTQGYQSRIDIKIKLVLQGIMFVSLGMVGLMFALLVEVMMFNVIMRIMFLAWMMVVMVHMMPFFKAQMRV